MRICERALNFVQIINADGDVRLCCWRKDGGIIGNLKENNLYEIWHGEKANKIRRQVMQHDFSNCCIDACPYLAMKTLSEHEVEIDEITEYPEELYLAYEEVCNYQCTSCTQPRVMKENQEKNLTEAYDLIEERIKDALPFVRHISANGRGEVFVSRRIMKMLQEWKPICRPEDAFVTLETNASMFDALHWKQIENLGNYHLYVAVTVMSFNEYAYQYLSGTKLPITRIENNLHFIKDLREKGIINELEIATVVQERNFRYLPEFTRRCIEEFGADTVRLRPYMPWRVRPLEEEWFADVRNSYHPYNEEYLEIIKHPIFQHPKVQDWSGGLSSETGEYPAEHRAKKNGRATKVLSDLIIHKKELLTQLKEKMQEAGAEELAVYGFGVVGRAFVKTIEDKIRISHIYDSFIQSDEFGSYQIFAPERKKLNCEAIVIVTPVMRFCEISKKLVEEYDVDIRRIVALEELVFYLGNDFVKNNKMVSEKTGIDK